GRRGQFRSSLHVVARVPGQGYVGAERLADAADVSVEPEDVAPVVVSVILADAGAADVPGERGVAPLPDVLPALEERGAAGPLPVGQPVAVAVHQLLGRV